MQIRASQRFRRKDGTDAEGLKMRLAGMRLPLVPLEGRQNVAAVAERDRAVRGFAVRRACEFGCLRLIGVQRPAVGPERLGKRKHVLGVVSR